MEDVDVGSVVAIADRLADSAVAEGEEGLSRQLGVDAALSLTDRLMKINTQLLLDRRKEQRELSKVPVPHGVKEIRVEIMHLASERIF